MRPLRTSSDANCRSGKFWPDHEHSPEVMFHTLREESKDPDRRRWPCAGEIGTTQIQWLGGTAAPHVPSL